MRKLMVLILAGCATTALTGCHYGQHSYSYSTGPAYRPAYYCAPPPCDVVIVSPRCRY